MLKKLSIALSAMMILSLFTPIYAANNNEADKFTELITLSKKIFKISNDYDDVSTETSESRYIISWGFKDSSKNERVRAIYNTDGYLLSYSKYNNEAENKKSNISVKDAEKLVLSTLNSVYPKRKYQFYVINSNSTARIHHFSIGIKFGDTPVYNCLINVEVDKVSAEVSNIFLNETAIKANYAKVDGLKFSNDKDKAYQAMLKANPLYLFLMKNNASGDEKLYPYYDFMNKSPLIDANSLKPVDYDIIDAYGMGNADKEAYKNDDGLSENEIKEVETIKNSKSKEQATKKAVEFFEITTKKLESSRLYKDNRSNYYIYNLRFDFNDESKYTNVSLRANDLFPIYYSKNFYSDEKTDKKTDVNKAGKIIDKFNKKLALNYDMLNEKMNMNDLTRVYFKKYKDYYLKDDCYSLSANDKYLTSYSYQESKNKTPQFASKKIDQKKAEDDVKAKGEWQKFILLELKPTKTYSDFTIESVKAIYAFGKSITEYDAINGKFFDRDNPGPIYKPTGDTPEDLVDIVDAGFGVASEKSFDDNMTYRDLMFNIANLNDGYIASEDEVLKKFQDLDIFKKENLDKEINAGEFFRAYYKDLLGIKKELDTKYFAKSSVDAKYSAYVALARASKLIDDKFKADGIIKVKDALKIFSNIYFK